MSRSYMGRLTFLVSALAFVPGVARPAESPSQRSTYDLFARTNLVAWCIVPFDAKKRGPEERGQMLEQLGIRRLAYDWRVEHIPTFDAEVAAMKRHGVEMMAWWFPGALNAEARAILDCIKRNNIRPQLWVMLEGGPHLRFDKAFEATPEAQAAMSSAWWLQRNRSPPRPRSLVARLRSTITAVGSACRKTRFRLSSG